ncbi:aryl-alcohol dehydrogenase-like predicted oxidoreductase [Actinophytocola oryzae]|uniref:Aryl-alcohol dehydrogenase-like predicted oxidoreductase n=2 Tax=Actinophytocola oryzae TaxID=502181 RepID=A0A4R7UTH6_9PSEU|nr:aryl-alcohol dehydrogenase-like predicted oxidoreductase [Actinophytocola oryzae]
MRVSPLCLGTLMLGSWGHNDTDSSIRIIDEALDAGINFIDTADVYSAGRTEEIIGKALARRHGREHIVLCTKVHAPMGPDPNFRGNSRRWIIQAAENSLRRLGTDWIDLYQVHRPDPMTDIDETLGALTDLVRTGKVRYLGSSTFPADQIVEAQWSAERRSTERFVCEQPPYSLLARGVEADVLPACRRHDMGVVTWSPLAGGWLTGRYRSGKAVPDTKRSARWPRRYDMSLRANQEKLAVTDDLAELAEQSGLSMTELALAFVLEHPVVTSAIIGPRTPEQLSGLLSAPQVSLGPDVLDRIDEIVAPGTTFNAEDAGWQAPELGDPAARRRHG